MRIPLAVNLESRDGTVSKDAKVKNGIVEAHGDETRVRMRSGVSDLGLVKAGIAQLLYSWNGIKAILADTLNAFTLSTVTTPIQTGFTPTVASQQFSAQDNGSNSTTPLLMVHNGTQAWSVNLAGAIGAITLPPALGTHVVAITSLTRVGTVATALLAVDPQFEVGQSITIAGATPPAYNGAQTVTAVTNASSTPARSIPITVTRSGATATATTVSGDHGLTNGSTYTISGADQAAYNGAFVITVTSSTTFTFTVTVTTVYTALGGTWNASDKAAGVTLSDANLTATTNGATYAAVRGTVGKSSGKWFWEVMATGSPGLIGVANSSMPLSDFVGGDANSWSYDSGGSIAHNGTFVAAPAFGSGDVVGTRLDMDTGTVTFFKNGFQVGSFAGLSGTIYAALSNASAIFSATANFGATGFTYDLTADPLVLGSGSITVTDSAVVTVSSFTFTIGGSPVTPATGTLTGTYTKRLVPGIPYLDGTFYVMDETGVIYNTTPAGDDPTTFPALGFITAQNENGGGVAAVKSQSYVGALKEWSTEFYYNALNATGSPLSPVQNGFTQVGCASGDSVAELEGTTFWISQARKGGRGVHMMNGLQQQKISTPDVDRILNADDLVNVRAFAFKDNGHSLYLLTLVDSNISIVYDVTSQTWTEASSFTISSTPSIVSITRSGNTATVTTLAVHGLSDGEGVLISGATQSAYNGIHQIQYVSATVFTYRLPFEATTPATGTLIFGKLTETYFKFTKHLNYNGQDLFLHESDGHLYLMDSTQRTDAGIPITLFLRTQRLDGGTTDRKKMPNLRIVGDQLDGILMVRWSDDDCQTFSKYRLLDLNDERSEIRRLGGFRRRTIETRYISGNYLADTSPNLAALELEISK